MKAGWRTFRRGLLFLPLLALAGGLLWLAWGTYPYWSALFAPTLTTFSQENWRAAHPYKRLALAQDFLAQRAPAGMHRDEVVALLGVPDQQTSVSLTYLVALTTADFMALSFRLDERGRVVQAHIHQT